MDEHNCSECGKDCEVLLGYKPYEMKNDEFYCESCFKKVHGTSFDEIGEVSNG